MGLVPLRSGGRRRRPHRAGLVGAGGHHHLRPGAFGQGPASDRAAAAAGCNEPGAPGPRGGVRPDLYLRPQLPLPRGLSQGAVPITSRPGLRSRYPRLLLLVALSSACGGETSLPLGPSVNRRPEIRTVTITPPVVVLGGTATIRVDAIDPDGDRL